MDDEEDLMHKAVGWALREVGKKDLATEEAFLKTHHKKMPRDDAALRHRKVPGAEKKKIPKGTDLSFLLSPQPRNILLILILFLDGFVSASRNKNFLRRKNASQSTIAIQFLTLIFYAGYGGVGPLRARHLTRTNAKKRRVIIQQRREVL